MSKQCKGIYLLVSTWFLLCESAHLSVIAFSRCPPVASLAGTAEKFGKKEADPISCSTFQVSYFSGVYFLCLLTLVSLLTIKLEFNTSETVMSAVDAPPQEATRRLAAKKQTLDDAYAAPANFLEIDVVNPVTHGVARNRYTDYEVRMRVGKFQFRLRC